ncbi:hemolysin family protein [Hydrogenophaga sp. 5NK40-0174]|uniref:hemolysin family protein n=1 Tax=Hydrogenophaga sp. 5NK40-0174 TaxID=3127649 RepID=UPI003103AF71
MDIILIVFLTLLNGAFAMSELALASSRKARLMALAESGDNGARTALELLEHPTRFLSSVQVGITSIGMLNGIVGEAAFSDELADWLQNVGVYGTTAEAMATGIVVVIITFVTIVFGELVPKRIGQLYPEAVSRWVSRPMALVAKGAAPFVWLLTHTTQLVLKLLRIDSNAVQLVTEEEIRASLEEGVDAGIIEQHEHQMVRNVFQLDTRQLSSIMVPRSDIEWLEGTDSLDTAAAEGWRKGHSWYPVCRGGLDHVVGLIHLPTLMSLQADGVSGNVLDHVVPAVFVPETLSGMELLEQLRVRSTPLVCVVDEYGEVQGLLTAMDLLEAITGELYPEQAVDAWATLQADGSWLIDGGMPVAELKSRLAIVELPEEAKRRYNTVGGMMLSEAGRLLEQGESVECVGWRFEVKALEGRRIEEVIAFPLAPEPAGEVSGNA